MPGQSLEGARPVIVDDEATGMASAYPARKMGVTEPIAKRVCMTKRRLSDYVARNEPGRRRGARGG